MGDKTRIGWTDATWNFVRGCRRVSEGCRFCYAEIVAARNSGEGQPYEGLARTTESGEARWTGQGLFIPDQLEQPLRWTKERMIFVNSMSDLFFEEFSFEQIAAAFAVMSLADHHTYQILTKRPKRALEFFAWLDEHVADGSRIHNHLYNYLCEVHQPAMDLGAHKLNDMWLTPQWPLPNVWIGVSAENQDAADERVPPLLQMPAVVRFVSAEPLLGPIDFKNLHYDDLVAIDAFTGEAGFPTPHAKTCAPLDWVIYGGESGDLTKARHMDPEWIRQGLRDREGSGVKVFVKQMGTRWSAIRSDTPYDRKGEDTSRWPADLRVQEYPR